MIISVEDLKQRIQTGTVTDAVITARLESIEAVIRAYTNNHFQIREARFWGRSEGQKVYGSPAFMCAGDTVQITGSGLNDGLYVITAVTADGITLNQQLKTVDYNLVTVIRYPADVVQCAVDLFAWQLNMGEKVGIKSETISRHSVTYEDSATLYMGYPVGILNGLKLHRKARC